MFSQKSAFLGLAMAALVSAVFVFLGPVPRFNYDFENFFPVDDPELTYYQTFRKQFENDNDYLLIALGNEPDVFEQEFLEKAAALQNGIAQLRKVDQVVSLLFLTEPIIGAFGISERSLLNWEDPSNLKGQKQRILADRQYTGNLIREDGRFLNIIVKNEQNILKEDGDTLYREIDHLIREFGFEEAVTAGKIKAQGEFVQLLQSEFIFFLSISAVLIVILLWWIFRTWWGVVLPFFVLAFGVGWTFSIMLLSGKALDVMMVMQPTILLIIGLSGLVHFLTLYMAKLREGLSKSQAIEKTFSELSLAVFLTCLTTSLGFVSLYFTNVVSLKEFGLYTGIGVMIMFLAIMLLTPGFLYLFSPLAGAKDPVLRSFWLVNLRKLLLLILAHQKKVLVGFALLTFLAFLAVSQLKVDGYLLDNLPQDHPLVQDFEFFDEYLGGSKPLEFSIEVGKGAEDLLEYPVLVQMDALESFLETNFETGAIFSPLALVKGLNKAQNGGNSKAYVLPSRGQFERMQRYLDQGIRKMDVKILSEDQKKGRLSTRMADVGSYKGEQLKAKFRHFVETEIDNSYLQVRMTGTSLLIDKSHSSISWQMARGLSVAFVLVGLIAGFLFRSWRIALVVLLPNIIPLLWMGGLMWLMDIDLKLSTAIIFTVAFGIAVDDSIHFMTKLQSELVGGKSLIYAIKRTYLTTGKAIILTTIILSSGFFILTFSQFGVTYYSGLLISMSLIFALLADLILLPVLLLPLNKIWKKKFNRYHLLKKT
ncbi:efflux RND transporter permease subunit [Pararhodonellum marinum]|uniref:efflux RND transporter permease subunit n=1 Tax=Pararhodonellum marinum TaxID=2755358 RepID=UPI00188FBBC3|nr:MMPL family transporter [Pararhodonellum marinum]